MAVPSNIQSHPLANITDNEGDEFPPGSSFRLVNVCSNYQKCLTVQHNTNSGMQTWPLENLDDRKWTINFKNDDRKQVTFREYRTGMFLAASGTQFAAALIVQQAENWWWVYKGTAPNTFWLSTQQALDGFMHTWDMNPNDGANVLLFNRADASAGGFFNLPDAQLERWTGGLSWRMEATHEYTLWKTNQKIGSLDVREADLKTREIELLGREASIEVGSKAAAESTKAAEVRSSEVEQRAKDAEQRMMEAEQRTKEAEQRTNEAEQRMKEAEERLKAAAVNAKLAAAAAQTASEKITEVVPDDVEKVRIQLAESRNEVAKLKRELEEARKTSVAARLEWSIPPPKPIRPAQKLPSGWNPELLRRFDAGRRAIADP